MNLKDLLTLFIAFREQVCAACKVLSNEARNRYHILVGLAIAFAENIGRSFALSRTSPDPNTARDTLMSRRDWPSTKDVEAMITLIDDPGTG